MINSVLKFNPSDAVNVCGFSSDPSSIPNSKPSDSVDFPSLKSSQFPRFYSSHNNLDQSFNPSSDSSPDPINQIKLINPIQSNPV